LPQKQIKSKDRTVVVAREFLYVGFGDYKVAIYSNAIEVLEGLERRFREMIGDKSAKLVKKLHVLKENGTYYFSGTDGYHENERSLTIILNSVSKEIIHNLVVANPNYLWVHAGAVSCEGKGVLVFGSWGRGKSTIVTNLCKYGWGYLSDDIAPLDMNSCNVVPFRLTPFVRKRSEKEISLHDVGYLKKIEININENNMCQQSIPICAVVFPNYRFSHSPLEIAHCPPAEAATELIQRCLNFKNHRATAVRFLCNLVNNLPVVRVTFNNNSLSAERITKYIKPLL